MTPADPLSRRSAIASGLALLSGCGTPLSTVQDSRQVSRPTSATSVSLGFVGDVMFGRGVNEAQTDRPPEAVWGDVLPRLDALDGLFLNLECCLSTRGEQTPGRGYYFRADPSWAVPALARAGTAWAGLANNHVLDFGHDAFEDTLEALSEARITHAGAGRNRRAAFAPANVSVGGLDVAVVALTDRAPAYAAGVLAPGTAYLPMWGTGITRTALEGVLRRARRDDPDLLVVSLHWGPNWEPRPAERYRRLARWLVDAGADVVHGHSAHVPQGVEVYRGRPIIHDGGDFVDDYAVVGDLHNDRSFLFELSVASGRPSSLRLRPIVIEDAAVHLASDGPAAWVREQMRARSRPFGTTFERLGEALRCDLTSRN